MESQAHHHNMLIRGKFQYDCARTIFELSVYQVMANQSETTCPCSNLQAPRSISHNFNLEGPMSIVYVANNELFPIVSLTQKIISTHLHG